MKLEERDKKIIKEFCKNHNISDAKTENLIIDLESNKDTKSKRFLDKVIADLSNETIFFEKKTAFKNLNLLTDMGLKSLAYDVIKIIDSRIKRAEKRNDFVVHTEFEEDNIKDSFNITWSEPKQRAVIGVPENNLERLIACVNKNSDKVFINQFPLPDKGHIDFVYFNDDELNLVELKKWGGGDNPLYAIAELIKNYRLMFLEKNNTVLKHFKMSDKKYNKVNLIVLAPKEYYIGYKSKSLKDFFVIFNELNSILKAENINISLNYIDITRDACEKNVKEKYADYFNKASLPIKNLEWNNFIDDYIKKKLVLNVWKSQIITTTKDWENLL